MKSYIKIIDPGFYTSIQDKGRYGFRRLGFPVSGPMDKYAFNRVNKILSNCDDDVSVLECTLKGPTILFEGPSWVAICGAKMPIYKNDEEIKYDAPFFCDLGDVLKIGSALNGVRSYIGFSGGISRKKIYKSTSQYIPITENGKIIKGDKISLMNKKFTPKRQNKFSKLKSLKSKGILKVFQGPFWNNLDNKIKDLLINNQFKIGSNNRMGYRLSGNLPENNFKLHSSSVLPGTVQLTPKGDLIIAMRDGQVTGGYPRVFQLSNKAQSQLAQFSTGKTVRFIL